MQSAHGRVIWRRSFRSQMPSNTKYVHTSVVARALISISQFDVRALGGKQKPPERALKRECLDPAVSLKGAHTEGVHLELPECRADDPTPEIFQCVR